MEDLKEICGDKVFILIAVGLARGYQIWSLSVNGLKFSFYFYDYFCEVTENLQSNGDCEELVSDRQGPVKLAHLLPYPGQLRLCSIQTCLLELLS